MNPQELDMLIGGMFILFALLVLIAIASVLGD
jgi:hypothetical protein